MKRHILNIDSRTQRLGMHGVSVISHTDKCSKLNRLKLSQAKLKLVCEGLNLVILSTEVTELIIRFY